MKTNRSTFGVVALASLALIATQLAAAPVGTAITYQGRLSAGGNPVSGNYDLEFSLYDSRNGGLLVGANLTNTAVGVSNGLFTVALDFGGSPFDGSARWLELGVRSNGSGSFTLIGPRQALTATAYAITASNLSGTLGAGLLAGTYGGALTFTNLSNSFSGNGAGLINLNASTLCGLDCNGFWHLSGNSGGDGGTNFLGTTDQQPLEFRVNNARLLFLDPNGSVVGGFGSASASPGTTISGGMGNSSFSSGVTIGGGSGNSEQGGASAATIGGGGSNVISGSFIASSYGTISGGSENTVVEGALATIGGGYANFVQRAEYGTIGGGEGNLIFGVFDSTIGGGDNNVIEVGFGGFGATIGGGIDNSISWQENQAGTIGGGQGNSIGSDFGTVSGGLSNRIAGNFPYSAIAGGSGNLASGAYASVSGGAGNQVINDYASIMGGQNNMAAGMGSSIAGGAANTAAGDYSSIGGGGHNSIQAGAYNSSVAGGQNNTITTDAFRSAIGGGWSNSVTGSYAVVPGGFGSTATNYGFAAGHRAKAAHTGSLVWADSTDADFVSTASNQVSFRCSGGVRFTSGGGGSQQTVCWTPGSASWSFSSDRNLKEGLEPVAEKEVLERVARMPISEWNYSGYPQRHIGPMAQDFHALFPLNGSDTTLNSADLNGVTLAAIKGLYEVVQSKDAEIKRLVQEKDSEFRKAVHAKDAEIEQLRGSVAELRAAVSQLAVKCGAQ